MAQVLCNEAGVPLDEMMDDDVAARELALDSKMRAFFRISTFSHRWPPASGVVHNLDIWMAKKAQHCCC